MSKPDRACPDYPNECIHPWAHARTYTEVKATQAAPMIGLDPDALYVALDRQRRRRRMQWRTVAAEAGVSASTLTRIGQGHRPDADGLVRLLAWLGTTDLAPFITGAVAGAAPTQPNRKDQPPSAPWS